MVIQIIIYFFIPQSDDIEGRFQHSNSMRGNTPQISERYSEELRKLIQEMLSLDPRHKPSADEILAKSFLNNAAIKNKGIPVGLKESLNVYFRIFDEAYNKHYKNFEALVTEWGKTTASLEEVHYKCTAGTLSGSVIGAAGGITALVGAILAPFTFGASLIVSGVGVGVGVAGGVTGAVFSSRNTNKQKTLYESLVKYEDDYKHITKPILKSLNTLIRVLKRIKKFSNLDSTFDNIEISCSVGKRQVVRPAELVNLGLLANVGRIITQIAKVGRTATVAASAVTGVISGLLVILDVSLIVKDSIDIHQMRKGKIDDPENITFSVFKSIAQVKETHTHLCNGLKEIEKIYY
uniref:Protein kinase domain-containing protein n=1 Tax=Sinocyclocheilus anshuiensis TaxID=1608454 RepID=A0A671SEC6_9TELE